MNHNIEISKNAPEHIKKLNSEFMDAYEKLMITIQRTQGWLEHEYVRTSVHSKMTEKEGCLTTILQCSTPWCLISIGCDNTGQFNIIYSLDARIESMIGRQFTETLLRRIHDFTSGMVKTRVFLGKLNEDCIGIFEQLKKDAEYESFHKLTVQEKFS
jgi:hypothetical protein